MPCIAFGLAIVVRLFVRFSAAITLLSSHERSHRAAKVLYGWTAVLWLPLTLATSFAGYRAGRLDQGYRVWPINLPRVQYI